jgi:hypothetical protein
MPTSAAANAEMINIQKNIVELRLSNVPGDATYGQPPA